MVIQKINTKYRKVSDKYSYNYSIMYQEFWTRYMTVADIKKHLTNACLILEFVEPVKEPLVDMDSNLKVRIIAAFSNMMSCVEFVHEYYDPGEVFYRMDTIRFTTNGK